MEKLPQESVDLVAQNVRKLQELFPECVTEARDDDGRLKQVVDFERLKQALTGEVSYDPEAYQFTWVGKKEAYADAFRSTRKILRPCPEESLDWNNTKNLYLEGDNLEVLKLLQESYLRRVKLIYIDPPYNTGSDAFVYPDDYTMDEQEYEEFVGRFDKMGNILFKENNASNPRFHSDWCSMIYARLLIARNLLSDDGAIFIHIDEHEVYNLAKICCEVFGWRNEIGTIIWDKRNPKGLVKGVAYQHESILIFCKDFDCFSKNRFTKVKEHAEDMLKEADRLIKKYKGVTEEVRKQYKGWIQDNKRFLTGGEIAYSFIDDKGRIYQPVSMAAPDRPETRSHKPLIHPLTGKPCPVPAKGWRFTDAKMNELLSQEKIEFGVDESTQPRQKYFLSENLEEAVSSLIYYGGCDDVSETRFDNPKPLYIAKRLIRSLCKKDEIVLDFFSGSATTAHAVMELNAEDGGNRQFIMVQLPESCDKKSDAFKAGYKTICEIGKERIRRAGAKIKSEHALDRPDLDVGFRVFKVDEGNMTDAYYYPSEYTKNLLDPTILSVKPDRTELDLLFGCVLDWGLPLSLPYKIERIGEATVHNYAEGALFACFDARVSIESVIAMACRSPLRVVFRESSFERSDEKINVAELFKQYSKYPTRIKTL